MATFLFGRYRSYSYLLPLGAGGGVKTCYPDVLSYCTAQAHP